MTLIDILKTINFHKINTLSKNNLIPVHKQFIKFGDDLGTNNGPLIPVETYREFFKPRYKMMCDYVKKHSSMRTMLHCCAGIYELIPELIEAGFEILNPVQINAINMEPSRLKNEFGKDITFRGGGADTRNILNNATPTEVKDHVKYNIEIFSKDGGFVFNTHYARCSSTKYCADVRVCKRV